MGLYSSLQFELSLQATHFPDVAQAGVNASRALHSVSVPHALQVVAPVSQNGVTLSAVWQNEFSVQATHSPLLTPSTVTHAGVASDFDLHSLSLSQALHSELAQIGSVAGVVHSDGVVVVGDVEQGALVLSAFWINVDMLRGKTV